jgi:hypothetical protein
MALISGFFFLTARIFQLLTLPALLAISSILTQSLLSANIIPPTYLLLPFITSILATVWALGTLLRWRHSRDNSQIVALFDLALFACFIATAVELSFIGIAGIDCSNSSQIGQFSGYGNEGSACGMLKACFGFAVLEVLLFAFSTLVAAIHRTKPIATEGTRRDERQERRRDRR